MSISNVDVVDPVGVFVSKYCREEKIPKDIMQRSDYIYIYVRNGIVDKVCYYSKIPKTFNRFVKGTTLVNENGRVWHTPTRKYMLWLGDSKLEEDVCYFVQYKHTGSSAVYKAHKNSSFPGFSAISSSANLSAQCIVISFNLHYLYSFPNLQRFLPLLR